MKPIKKSGKRKQAVRRRSRNWLLPSLVLSLAVLLLVPYCAGTNTFHSRWSEPVADSALDGVPVYSFKVVNTWAHDPEAYTQGLIYADGILYESTGRYGQSSLRKVELTTGRVLKKVDVDPQYFAEGMTLFQGKIFQLTWKAQKGFIYDTDFNRTGEFTYEGEGWGLTHDAESLIMSDGTNRIRFLDPHTLKVQRTISVIDHGKPLLELNELEYIRGEIFANIWQTDRIVRLDPHDGKILGWVDMMGLLKLKDDYDKPVDVLNGIAYDEAGDRLFVTGKLWPKLFEIRLKKK
ncbi:MAG: glutaminyl-peptide cyclotransferase [Pyrinomonadaceae bacterium]